MLRAAQMEVSGTQLFVHATELKAKCLALLDQVGTGTFEVIVTKRGQPVAVLHSAMASQWPNVADSWAIHGQAAGDIVQTEIPAWDALADGGQ